MLHKATTFILVALLLAPLAGAQDSQPTNSAPLRVIRSQAVVEIDNGLVKARFSAGKDGVKQDYLAARGDEWVLLAEGFRPGTGKKAEVQVFADFEGETYGDWQAVGEAFGPGPSLGATAPEQLLRGFQGRRLANSYAKSDKPVGKLISPEFTIRQPYLRFLIGGGNHPGGTCIHLVVDGKTVHQHVWFQHMNTPGAMVRELSAGEVRIGMDLLLADAPHCRGYQMAAQHLWRRFGSEYFRRPRPQAMPYAEYAKVCYPANFLYQGYNVVGRQGLNHRQFPERPDLRAWQQWEVDGQPVGGLRLYAPQWYNYIANLGWWNSGHATRCRSPGPCRGSFRSTKPRRTSRTLMPPKRWPISPGCSRPSGHPSTSLPPIRLAVSRHSWVTANGSISERTASPIRSCASDC